MATEYREDSWRKAVQDMEIGDTFVTKSRVITRTETELFALLGGDTIPMFLSEDGGRKRGWNGQLVPGLCTLNIAYGLLMQGGFLKDVLAYMGTRDMEFVQPVYPGDAIWVKTKVTAKKETKKGTICDYDWTIYNQDDVRIGSGHNYCIFKPYDS